MANSDKNIRITTSKNKTTYPNIVFTGSAAGSSVITLEVLDDNTLSFTSNEGQVFSIDSNLSTGTIWAVSDISGVPMLSSSAGGTVGIAVYGGLLGIGQTNPTYKLDLKGSFGLASSNDALYNFIFSNSAASGSNSLQIRSANSLLLYNSGNTFYTGLKSNASANVTYTLPVNDGSSGQYLSTNGSGVLSWGTPAGGSGGGSTGVGNGGQYEVAYYPGTGSSVIGNANLKNNTATSVVSVSYSTNSTDFSSGAFTVSGGVGIGGTLNVGTGASIAGVRITGGAITLGAWNATLISPQYGGTGLNNSSATGLLQYSSGTASVITTSAALATIISDETGTAGKLVFSTSPTFTTSVITDSASFDVFNTTATTINAFSAGTAITLGAATGTLTLNNATTLHNQLTASTSPSTGAIVVNGSVGIGRSVSVGGRLQFFNGSNYAAFLFAGTANTTYTLPANSPATGTSVLQSDSGGILSWVPMVASSSSGAGSGTVAIPGAQYQIAAYYWSATGASVSGSSTFTNNTATAQVAITHNTASTSTSSGALAISGGLGIAGNAFIGGTINVPSASASNVSNVIFTNGVINSGTWAGSTVTAFYGGTGYNSYTKGDILVGAGNTFIRQGVGVDNFVLTASAASPSGVTWSSVPPSAASSVAVVPTNLNQSFFITTVSSSNGSGLGLSTITSFVVNPFNGIVSMSGLAVTAGTASATTTSGALTVTGGLGITGNAFIGGTINVPSANVSNISGVLFANNIITSGTWAATAITGFYGGTGYNSYTTGDILIGAGSTFIKLNSGASNLVLTSTGTGSVPSWQSVPPAAASSVAVAAYDTDALFYPTFVNASSGSALGLTTDTNLTSNPGKNQLTVTNVAGTAITTSLAVYSNQVQINSGNVLTIADITGSAIATFDTSNGWFRSAQTTESTSNSTGALVSLGGLAVAKNSFLGGTGSSLSVLGTSNSTSTSTGSLVVFGGFGLASNAFIGGTTTVTSTTASVGANSGALVVAGGAGIAGTLFTGTGFSSSVSGVVFGNSSVTAASYNKLIITAPTSTATLTLANSSSLITSGANPLTLTTTNTSNVTFPTAGTLITTGNKLSDHASTTSSELAGVISDETGSGALVFATGPTLVTPNIGAATGTSLYLSAISPSNSTITGALIVPGGVGIGLSASIGGRLQMFNGANYTAFVSSASGNITYTLPPTAPSGTGTSYLSSSTTGVMAWVAAPTSGGGSPGGSNGQIQYNNGGAFAGISGLTYVDPGSGIQLIVNTPADSISGLYGILNIGPKPFDGVSSGFFNGTTRGTVIAINAGNGFTGDFINANIAGVSGFAVSANGQITIGNNIWKLPTLSGNAGEILYSAGSGGKAYWAAAPTGTGAGSGTVAIPGAQYQLAAYYWSATGASVSGSSTFTNNTATGVVDINHTTESTSTTTGSLVVDGGAGIAKSLYVGTTLQVGQNPNYNIPNNLASFTSTVDSYNQLVIANKSSGTSASANLVINNNQSTDSIFYGELGMNSSTFSGTGALGTPNAVYVASTSSPLVLGTTTQHPIRFVVNGSATDILYIDGAGAAISCFTNFGLRSANDIRFWDSTNQFYAAISAPGALSQTYTLIMPTKPVGAGASALITGSDGQMYFVAPGAGIAFSNSTSNTPTIRAKRALTLQFAAGFTPIAAGPDNVILKIPQAVDGVSLTTFQLRELDIRVETPSAGSSRIQLEKYTGTAAFALGGGTGLSLLGGFGITLTGAGTYTTSTSFASGVFTTSNDKLRLNWTLLNATHANFSIQLTMEEV